MLENYSKKLKLGGSGAVVAALSVTGLAGAAPGIDGGGPNSTNSVEHTQDYSHTQTNNNLPNLANYNDQSAQSGDASSTSNGGGNNIGSDFTNMNWASLDPATAQANGSSYNDWWNAMNGWLGYTAANSTDWMTNTAPANVGWTPGATDSGWQNTWTNWDPATWEANGQSYANWYNGLVSHLTANAANWSTNWDAAQAGSTDTASGDAVNEAENEVEASITNGSAAPVATPAATEAGSISNTGPNSDNSIDSTSTYTYTVTNNNDIDVTNDNQQTATSGDATSSNNTSSGSAQSGDSANLSSNNVTIEVANF